MAAIALRSPVPVVIDDRLTERVDPLIESAGYFVVSELLTNSAKHAGASRVTVSLDEDAGDVVIEVRDDGIGGASAGAGATGLVGLVDRLTAIGGSMSVDSPAGEGTTVRARLPVA